MVLDNFPANGESDPDSFVLLSPVQSLEGLEDLVQVLFVEADAIILYTDLISVFPAELVLNGLSVDLHIGDMIPILKFEGIGNDILKQLDHLDSVRLQGRQLAHFEPRFLFRDQHLQVR